MCIDSKFYAKRDMSPSPACRFQGGFGVPGGQNSGVLGSLGRLAAVNTPASAHTGAMISI